MKFYCGIDLSARDCHVIPKARIPTTAHPAQLRSRRNIPLNARRAQQIVGRERRERVL